MSKDLWDGISGRPADYHCAFCNANLRQSAGVVCPACGTKRNEKTGEKKMDRKIEIGVLQGARKRVASKVKSAKKRWWIWSEILVLMGRCPKCRRKLTSGGDWCRCNFRGYQIVVPGEHRCGKKNSKKAEA